MTPLQGIGYSNDTGQVFDYFKSWTLNGPAWMWMHSFNTTHNGRGASIALLAQFEGAAQKDRQR
jgi:hypothetical protein